MTLISKLFCSIITVLSFYRAACQEDAMLSVGKIPPPLLQNANAVVRYSSVEIEVISLNEVRNKARYAVTILNQKGSTYGVFRKDYGKFEKIKSIKGWLYDKDGNEITRTKKADIKDIGEIESNLIDDVRYKFFNFDYSSFPYTVVFEYESEQNQTLSLPSWHPQPGYDCAVEQADFSIEYPNDFQLRYKKFHLATDPISSTKDNKIILAESSSMIKAIKKPDDFVPFEIYRYPALILATDHFQLLEEEGHMKTWEELGKFFYILNDKRDALAQGTKTIVHSLTDTCRSEFQKISVLYDYLKNSTRYVSIQLGIGGWQTLEATYVAEKGYGDCKALSNYMKALLKEAGIPSYQALVYAGSEEKRSMINDFPCNTFNHVILCVPQKEDTVWLECTSKTSPASYLSTFTANRNVLLLTPSGGYIVKTPAQKLNENLLCAKATLSVVENNDVRGNIESHYSGDCWSQEGHAIFGKTKSEIQTYFNRKFTLPDYTVDDFKINNIAGRIPAVDELISLHGSGLISKNGNELIIHPRIFSRGHPLPTTQGERIVPFEIFNNRTIQDTVIINLPAQYEAEALPQPFSIEYEFGRYTYIVILENRNTLKIVSTYMQKEGVYKAEQFADYVKFCRESANDHGSIVLSKMD